MEKFTYRQACTKKELSGAFDVRKEVFVVEQGIPDDIVFDGAEGDALHFIVADGKQVVGTVRLCFPDEGQVKQAKIERMAVLKQYRGMHLGVGILSFVMGLLESWRIEKVTLHAQSEVVEFYEKCGFQKTGSPFVEVGISHVEMEKLL